MPPSACSLETRCITPRRSRPWPAIACATTLLACVTHDKPTNLRIHELPQAQTWADASGAGAELPPAEPAAPDVPFAERELLPDPFPISSDGFVVVNHAGLAQPGELPTNNDYDGAPGCYVACYSHSDDGIVYRVSQDIGVKGQFRTQGHYVGRVCQPEGWLNRDISKAGDVFARSCDELVPTCHGDCWAGGDTGGWFGIQG